LPWQPIFDKFGELIFIQHAGVPKWIRLSQFRLKIFSGNIFFYTLCKFDQNWSSNAREYEGKNCFFWRRWQKSEFRTKYLSKYQTDRNHNFSADRQMFENFKTDINFVVA